MKSIKQNCVTAITLLAALAIPVSLTADDAGDHHHDQHYKHHHYKLIDMGTFGGPNSWFDSLSVTDGLGFGTVFYNNSLIGNAQGIFVGFADTSMPDPYPGFCYMPDCFVAHAFQWRNGVTTDLGALPGGVSSAAFWVNERGWIAGNSENGETDPVISGLPEVRAVLWKDGYIHDLGTLGGSASFSQAINNRGQITGLALNDVPDPFSYYYQFLYCLPFAICPANATQTRAFVWDEKDGMQDIGTLGGPDAFPSVMNNRGQVAGYSYTNSTPNPTFPFVPTFHPFLWEKGKGMKDLGTLGGTQTASVNGLNERGEVVGGLLLPGDVLNHPFLWDGRKLIDLVGPPFDPSQNGEARWINDAGDVIGSAGLPVACDGQGQQSHAFLWSNGEMTDLGNLPGSPNSEAEFINSGRQVVCISFSCEGPPPVAFLWERGSMIDLNSLISGSSQFFLYWSTFVSDSGEIAAYASLANGDSHAVLLVPCDENHKDIEDCDFSEVEESDNAMKVGSPPVAQNPTTTNPWRARPMTRFFGQRSMPGPWLSSSRP